MRVSIDKNTGESRWGSIRVLTTEKRLATKLHDRAKEQTPVELLPEVEGAHMI